MRLVPGSDRVIRHICIWCIVNVFFFVFWCANFSLQNAIGLDAGGLDCDQCRFQPIKFVVFGGFIHGEGAFIKTGIVFSFSYRWACISTFYSCVLVTKTKLGNSSVVLLCLRVILDS